MQEILKTLKNNQSIVLGAGLATAFGGAAVGVVQKGVTTVAGNALGKWTGVGASLVAAGVSVLALKGRPQLAASVAAVFIGHAGVKVASAVRG